MKSLLAFGGKGAHRLGLHLLWAVVLALPTTAWAEPVDYRFYLAPMASFMQFGDSEPVGQTPGDTRARTEVEFDNDTGWTLAIGKPVVDFQGVGVNLEAYAYGFSGVEDEEFGGRETDIDGFGFAALVFPFRQAFPIFALIGIGSGDYDFSGDFGGEPLEQGDADFVDYGIGVMIDLPFDFDYGVKLRAEYRWRDVDVEIPNAEDLALDTAVASIGLLIPLGAPPQEPKPEPPPPPPPPAPEPMDTDGDGVLDDQDQCPGTPPGTEVDASGCPVEKDQPIVLKGVTFEFNSARLTAEAEARLDNVVNALKSAEKIHVRIEGHTDSIGSASYNLDLSQRRAQSVKRYLVEHGIDPGRLTTEGYGETKPVAPNNNPDGSDNPAGRAKNRRVELHVVDQ